MNYFRSLQFGAILAAFFVLLLGSAVANTLEPEPENGGGVIFSVNCL